MIDLINGDFVPPTENTDLATNRIDEQALTARVESVERGRIRARIEGRLRMQHPFYHKDDNNQEQFDLARMDW